MGKPDTNVRIVKTVPHFVLGSLRVFEWKPTNPYLALLLSYIKLLMIVFNINGIGVNMEKFILPHLEWEVLREPITIPKVDDRAELPKGKKKIVINRDEDYNLRATLYFKDSTFKGHLRQSSAVAGSFPEKFDIQGSYLDSVLYTLESCLIGETTIRRIQDGQESFDTAFLNFQGLRMRYKNEKEGTHLTEWYLNGPRDDVFCRVTDRKVLSSFFRQRFASKEDKINSIKISRDASSVGIDFLRIKACDFQFLVTRVPKGIGPSWSSNIGIEYRKAWGRIPDMHEREKIEELCSFIFGRQLLSVGYTIYDQNENMVEGYAVNPWGREARSFCSKHYDKPPIRINNSTRGKAEHTINQLLPTYYEMRESLCLKEALWNYWISRDMPIGTNLPILAAAVESIINGWFKYTKSKSQGVYMKKEEFEALLKEEIEAMTKKLEGKLNGDKIVEKILKAYDFGIMERYRVFFEEINLTIGDLEWEAIKERHEFVHGRVLFGETDWKRVIQHANTFETLLHKVLLKLLGYSGTFIDRSVLGWKDKQLS